MSTATKDTVIARVESRWHRISRTVRWIIAGLVVLLVAARLALPSVIKSYVNRQLHKLPDYTGQVQAIDVRLWRGAYRIRDLAISKTGGQVPVPFFSARAMDLSLQWKELFHGSLVAKVNIDSPEVNFVGGSETNQTQSGTNQPWVQTLESLYPFRINELQVSHGAIHFRNFQKSLPVNIFVTNLAMVATNLSNARNQSGKLPAGVQATGATLGDGRFSVNLKLNPLAPSPTFELNAVLTNVNMVALNDFMRSYGKFDVERGNFSLYTSVASADGKYDGFAKVLFKNLDVFAWEKERKKNVLEIFWEGVVGVLVEGFKNHPHDQLATKIPISGSYASPHMDILGTVGSLLQNAFVRALLPTIGPPVHIEDAEKKNPPLVAPAQTYPKGRTG